MSNRFLFINTATLYMQIRLRLQHNQLESMSSRLAVLLVTAKSKEAIVTFREGKGRWEKSQASVSRQ